MSAKLKNTPKAWVDPDDAPELTDELFDKGVWRIGAREVSPKEGKAALGVALRPGRPKSTSPKQALTVRYDAEVVQAFKATGRGWQTRMNDALKDWLKNHSPA